MYELLRSLEDDDYVPPGTSLNVSIMPPINACDPNCDTDEDSGNEEVNINNLPGNQLLAETDVEVSSGSFSDSSEQEWEEEDLVPLPTLLQK